MIGKIGELGYGAVAIHNGLPFIGEVLGKNADKDLATVEGMNGDKIEDSKTNIEKDKGVKKWSVVGRENKVNE